MPKSTMRRRRFVHLITLSAAAAAGTALSSRAGGATQAADPAKSRRREAPPEPGSRDRRTPAVRREIENQKKTLSASVRAVRDYELPAGSDPAFVFRPRVHDGKRSRD